jgi:uncharacterized delta-60 repeat protein
VIRVVLICLAALPLAVPAASADVFTAPGRIAFDVGAAAPIGDVDAGGASQAVALPGGATVLAGMALGQGLVVAQVRADGSLDPSFGDNGIAHHAVGSPFILLQMLRQADGRLLLAGTTTPPSRLQLPSLVLVRLDAHGSLDRTFGKDGIASAGIQGSCGSCEPIALQPDGSIVATGTTGEGPQDPRGPATLRWAVTRLTPAGMPDPTFGNGSVIGLTEPNGQSSGGFGVQTTPDGRVIVLGRDDDHVLLAGLTRDGKLDPGFHAATPVVVPLAFALSMLRHPSGAIDVLGISSATLVRFTSAGDLDNGFGSGGSVKVATGTQSLMLPAADDGTLVYASASYEPRPSSQAPLLIQHIDTSGRAGAVVKPPAQFGGGYASSYRSSRLPTTLLDQNSFSATRLVQRSDGSYLAAGGVRIVQYSGEGSGFSTGLFAAEALTPAFGVNTSFGGPSSPASSSVRAPRQKPLSDARLNRVLVRVAAAQPGLMLLRVRDGHRRILAQSLEPIWAAGTTTVRIPLTAAGHRILRRARSIRVLVGRAFRDVMTGGYESVTITTLR